MVPPVPIPNTVVKHSYVESTWLETTWEDRKLLVDDAPERVRFSLDGLLPVLHEESCFSQMGKKYIPKSDSAGEFSQALIFYGCFHDIMKYGKFLFHVFFLWLFKAKHGCQCFFG